MSIPQTLFLGGFTAVLLVTVAFAGVVVARATRAQGASAAVGETVRRLSRLPHDRSETARWAFVLHRVSGFSIFAFLALHLFDVGMYAVSPEVYDEVHGFFGSVPLRVFECALLFAILFHTFNGLRLIALDLMDAGPRSVAILLWAVLGLTVVLGAAGSAIILAPVFR